MKRAGKIAICLAATLTLNNSVRATFGAPPSGEAALNAAPGADEAVLPGNPYAPIVARNVFALVPVPVVDPNPPPAEPPLKITLNGIMSILGHWQALFKVTGKPGGKVDSYMLAEGQGQDDIEVTKIDEKNSLVTFNNHGVVQTLPLINGTAAGGGMTTATAAGGNPAAPAFNPYNGGNNNGAPVFGRFGQRGAGPNGLNRGGQNAPAGNNLNGGLGGNGYNGNNGGDAGLNFQGASPGNNSNLGPAENLPQMAPEEQAASILINTEKYKQENNPAAMLMPPVPGMTPPDDDPQK